MATPHSPTHVTVGGLLLRTFAIDCYNWSALIASPSKRGSNRPIPGVAGRAVRPRVPDELRAGLPVRVRGDWDHDTNVKVAGGPDEWTAHLYVLLGMLRDVADVVDVQTLGFTWPGGSVEVDCQVEELTAPTWVPNGPPWAVTTVLDVTLPDGPIDLSGGS